MNLEMAALLPCLLLFGVIQSSASEETVSSSTVHRTKIINEYRARIADAPRQIAEITQCAEAVAGRWAESRHTLLHFYCAGNSMSFVNEQWSRAGGLDNVRSLGERKELCSTNDVFVAGPRSWEKGAADLKKQLAIAKKNGWMTIVFGSRNGMPADLPVDYLIDNGASSGDESEAALNQIVNITKGWMWNCELTAALTRAGWHPGVLKGMPLPGSIENNKVYQIGTPQLYPCKEAIPAGALARAYLDGIEQELADLESRATQDQIARAARLAVAYINSGRSVCAASITHALDFEVTLNLKSPLKAFGIPDADRVGAITKNVKSGDLFFFFGEWTMNLPWADFLAIIRSTQADYIPSFRPGNEPMEPFSGPADFYDRNVKDAVMILEQHWPFENAVVPIPFPPGKMAPVSGVYVSLMYRMLDEAIADRLAAEKPKAAIALMQNQ